ncbi:MAG: hypothetical protein GY835_04460 [bacterium]|nr:hypothetical protein [bacterium]
MPDRFPASIDTPPFGLTGWLVDPARNKITKAGRDVQLEPRLMHVLVCLASRQGEVLSRRELIDAVWSDTVVNEDALTRAVSDLRRAFRADRDTPEIIETIRKGGYCLVAAIEPSTRQSGTKQPAPLPPIPESEGKNRRQRLALILILLTFIAVIALSFLPMLNDPPLSTALRGRPLTNLPGTEQRPALSPDGSRLAYSRDAGEGRGLDIYIEQCDGGPPLRLTSETGHELCPAWSPTGGSIAYFGIGERSGIYVIPALGGAARWIADFDGGANGLDWSPDGKLLALSAACEGGGTTCIALLNVETGERRLLSNPSEAHAYDIDPAWSPDGSRVAFTRTLDNFHETLHLVEVDTSRETELTTGVGKIFGLDWTRDGRHIIYGGAEQGDAQLWRLTLADGSRTRLPCQSEVALRPGLATNADRLVFEGHATDINIEVLDWRDPDSRTHPIVGSTRSDFRPRFSPSGERLAFISARSGTRELWVAAVDGSAARQVSHFEGPPIAGLSWSPDSGRIAVALLVAGRFQVRILELEGARVSIPHIADEDERVLLWSRDGRWLYLATGSERNPDVRRVTPDGTRSEDMNWPALVGLCESRTGELFSLGWDGVIGRWSEQDGSWVELCGSRPGEHLGLAVVRGGLLCSRGHLGRTYLELLAEGSREPEIIRELPRGSDRDLSISADGCTVALTRVMAESDIILVEDFH